jgi:RNA methyltransferase, TrmH family
MRITSSQNPRIKEIKALKKAAKRRKDDLIIIEGHHEIAIALASGLAIESLYHCPELAGDNALSTLKAGQSPVYELTPELFAQIAYREHPDGFLALAKAPRLDLSDLRLSANPLLIVVEGLEKPGNLGAIMRTADAAGVDAVILADPRTDIFNPNAIRASLGTVFSVPSVQCSTRKAIEWLREKNIRVFAACLESSENYIKLDYTCPAAIVIGTEHEGLSRAWLDASDAKIKISMLGRNDSLNASVTAAVLVFEAKRQRSL